MNFITAYQRYTPTLETYEIVRYAVETEDVWTVRDGWEFTTIKRTQIRRDDGTTQYVSRFCSVANLSYVVVSLNSRFTIYQRLEYPTWVGMSSLELDVSPTYPA